ncbi:hypothetical protein [Lentilactobacillus hilgardii]|uniref:hypothetical protein n=1 Tax=Lentilactobacillus hilgardii TaxID=1588 RepID=UPI0021C27DCE|nr:hypothetical protein [Lentilactobacillus hilgardii]MCP9333540.1 hypothetical protein [Lentilactobacillus hilgardii]MCP9350117.1 hypothetical protein [Lentilactobacillus hilgardii]MCP9352994.1 hypothetical protein [Lentilactobacillus hilgardii]
METKSFYQSVMFASIVTSVYAIFNLNKDYQKSRIRESLLNKMIKQHRDLTIDGKYLGHWSVSFEKAKSTSPVFHFGYNYQTNDGNVEVHAFWVNYLTNKTLKEEVYELK